MSNETKVGILAVISIAIAIWGYKFLKGQNILTSSNIFYVEYEKSGMLSVSAPVFINDFPVGVVADMYLKPEDMKTIVAVLDIERDINIPKTTVAEIVATDVTGGKGVNLAFDKPCTNGDCAESGTYLKGITKGLLKSMVPQDELALYLDQLGGTVGEIMDTLNNKLTDPDAEGVGKAFQDLSATLLNLNKTTAKLDAMLARSSGNIENSLKNVEALTGKLNNNMASVDSILNNATAITAQLRDTDLKKTIEGTSANANEAITELRNTMATANKALGEVNTLLAGVKAGDGTIGKLFTDDGLYKQLSDVSLQLDQFLTDFERAPYRYMPLKSRSKVKRHDRKDGKKEVD